MKVGKTFYARNRREWRAWLARHHKTAPEIWLIYYKKHSGKPRVSYNDAVDEALCYGWIDSILKPIDADCYAQRFSPRRPTSRLSEMNRERVRRLIAARRMTRAGLQRIRHVFDHKKDTKKLVWRLPADIRERLEADPVVWKRFQRFPESYRRSRIRRSAAAPGPPEGFGPPLRYLLPPDAPNKRLRMVQ